MINYSKKLHKKINKLLNPIENSLKQELEQLFIAQNSLTGFPNFSYKQEIEQFNTWQRIVKLDPSLEKRYLDYKKSHNIYLKDKLFMQAYIRALPSTATDVTVLQKLLPSDLFRDDDYQFIVDAPMMTLNTKLFTEKYLYYKLLKEL